MNKMQTKKVHHRGCNLEKVRKEENSEKVRKT